MDIQSLKLDLVSRILKTDKAALLIHIKKLLQEDNNVDWWNKLSIEVQESIMEGMKDVEEENVYTHDQVIQEARQKYGF